MTARVVPATPEAIHEAALILRRGGLVAFPTETVYGLGAVATNDRAVAQIFEAKGRPATNPLIVHVLDRGAAAPLAVWSKTAETAAEAFWPGPLTLVLPRAPSAPLSPLTAGGFATLALRAPAHPVARDLLQATLLPIAAPSANRSGRISPTRAEHVAEELGSVVDLIVDGGPCYVGLESTVLDLAGAQPAILRPGSITTSQLTSALGVEFGASNAGASASPGQLPSHYAPTKPLRLNVQEPEVDETFLALGEPPAGAEDVINLSPSRDLDEAARQLFAALRAADAGPKPRIAAAPIPEEGVGRAINDRLRRAAHRD